MSGGGLVVLIALAALAIWWVDLRIHPIRRCPSCGGTKRNSANPARWGQCRRCGGTGEVRRFGAREKKP